VSLSQKTGSDSGQEFFKTALDVRELKGVTWETVRFILQLFLKGKAVFREAAVEDNG
jgi:hypothetical protein